MIEFCNIFNDTSLDVNIRRSAGTLVISTVKLRVNFPNPSYFWDVLSADAKNLIKNVALQNLMNEDKTLTKFAASIVAVIVSIEVPRGEWLNIVDILANNTTHEDIKVRRASIITIGDAC
jgi:importin subunit beta-1